jgi:hypothetical protein
VSGGAARKPRHRTTLERKTRALEMVGGLVACGDGASGIEGGGRKARRPE